MRRTVPLLAAGLVGACAGIEAESDTRAATLDAIECAALQGPGQTGLHHDVFGTDMMQVATTPGPGPTLAPWGSSYLFCNQDDLLAVVDRDTGETELTDHSCFSVATNAEGEIALANLGTPGQPDYAIFDSLDALFDNAPSQVIDGEIFPTAGPILLTESHLITAWHSGDRVTLHERDGGLLEFEIVLEGHDDWFDGLAFVDDNWLVLAPGDTGQVLSRYDRLGALLESLPTQTQNASGLSCARRLIDPNTAGQAGSSSGVFAL